ncbi:hypothetical protein GF345_00855 [Candidatus Woesearchaeota archaeon]|nr:hypothetical protein [Candidatus Woesearchaeota archaeon]
MDIRFSGKSIELKKELNSLDSFVINFTDILNKLDINYVVVSGYVSILFGRSRNSEDIDLIIEEMDIDKFTELWNALCKDFECIITDSIKDAYNSYLCNKNAIRFSFKGEFIPNMEVKFPFTELDKWVLDNKIKVALNKKSFYISPIELQISYKLFLGSEKDIEDARFLYKLFFERLDLDLLDKFNQKLKIRDNLLRYLE